MSSYVPASGVENARTITPAVPAVPITVHPLVLLNISDDISRANHNNQPDKRVSGKTRLPFGILMGTSGRETSVHTSIDFVVQRSDANGQYELDWAMATHRVNLCRTTLLSYDVVGWYTTGAGLTSSLVTTVHGEFLEKKVELELSNICPRPVVILIDPAPPASFRGVPICVFESDAVATLSQAHQAADAAASSSASNQSMLKRVEYQFESESTERIGVQQCADTQGAGGQNWVGPAADKFAGAVASLERRVQVITQYLKLVQDGKIEPDAEMLRRIKQCATKLPRPEDAIELRALLGEGVQDALSTTIVSLMAKGCLGLAQLTEDTGLGIETESRMLKM